MKNIDLRSSYHKNYINLNFDFYIFVGGKSSRFESDKASYIYNNEPIVDSIIRKISIYNKKIILVGKNNNLIENNYSIIQDIIPNIGPIGALYTAVTHTDKDYVFVLATDLPYFNTEISDLIIKSSYQEYDSTFILDNNSRIHPLIGMYNVQKIKNIIENQIANNDYKIQNLLKKIKTSNILVKKYQEKFIKNVNYKNDLV